MAGEKQARKTPTVASRNGTGAIGERQHGKTKGLIRPMKNQSVLKVREHPFFGMNQAPIPVEEEMAALRGRSRRDR